MLTVGVLSIVDGDIIHDILAIFNRQDIIELRYIESDTSVGLYLRDHAQYALVPNNLQEYISHSWEDTYYFDPDYNPVSGVEWVKAHKIDPNKLEWHSYDATQALALNEQGQIKHKTQEHLIKEKQEKQKAEADKKAKALQKLKECLPPQWRSLVKRVSELLDGAEILPTETYKVVEPIGLEGGSKPSSDGMRAGSPARFNPTLTKRTYRRYQIKLSNGELLSFSKRETEPELLAEELLQLAKQTLIETLSPKYQFFGETYYLGLEEHWVSLYKNEILQYSGKVFVPQTLKKSIINKLQQEGKPIPVFLR